MHNMEMVNLIQNFKQLPLPTKKVLGLGVVLGLVVALPLFIWAVLTQTFNSNKKASDTAPIAIDTTGSPYMGPIDAPITIVEFGDFQCPYCKMFHDQTLTDLLNLYPDKIRFVFKNFPLTVIHPQADIAANAAMCANEQNKFWEMSDKLFANQEHLSITDLKLYATELGLFNPDFDNCLDTSKYSSAIAKDVADGTSYGVTGTPTFYINGVVLPGALPINSFKEIIDPILTPVATPTPPTTTLEDCTPQNKVITVSPSTNTGGTCHNLQLAIDNVNGSGYKILIEPGQYDQSGTIHVSGKNDLTITGDSSQGNQSTVINFVPNGWGFLIENSSGLLAWLTIKGGSSNGMVSIHNSHNFEVGYANIESNSSHTLDVQNSSEISIFNSDIQSSAGAVEIELSSNVNVENNIIHNSANAISATNSGYVTILGNLIISNNESGVRLRDVTNSSLYNNSIIENNIQSGKSAVLLSGDNITLLRLTNNLIINNYQAGIEFEGTNFTRTVDHNDVWNNGSFNYIGLSDYTGVNGNISEDPLVNFNDGQGLCLYEGSPALYGDSNNHEYMGYIGSCGFSKLAGDTNSDGHVNIVDIGIIVDSYRSSPIKDIRADLNHDGIVNIVDIGIVVDNYEL